MNYIDKLIEKYCPNGVEYVPIKSCIFPVKNIKWSESDNEQFQYIDLSSVNRDTHEIMDTQSISSETAPSRAQQIIATNDILFGTTRPTLKRFCLVPSKYNNSICSTGFCVLRADNSKVYSSWLYHNISSSTFFSYVEKMQKGASYPSISDAEVKGFKIPLPPLEIQREIVRVLDKFTMLSAELSAELLARQKQYGCYREKLLSFNSDMQYLPFGEVCTLKAGKAISSYDISPTQTAEKSIPCYGGNGLRGFVKEANQNGNKSLIGRQGALCGNVCYATGDYYATEHAIVVTDIGNFNSRFLYHLLTYKQLNQYKTAGAQPGLSVSRLETILLPVPPIEMQNRIAHVLDNFDAICSDLNIGLPAEISARQKQYEYYRDLLLSFKSIDNITDRQTDRQSIIKLLLYVNGFSWVTLDEISQNCDNLRKPITSGKRESGAYPYYGASGIVDYVKDFIFDGDYLLISEDGANLLTRNTPIAFSISGRNWVNNHAHVLKFDTYELRRYVEFYLNSIDLSPYISGGAQPKLNQKNLNRIPIPMPAPSECKRIVSILDRFDTLCNDLSTGLPAEIAARQQQYEYYRDKLLTFKELT